MKKNISDFSAYFTLVGGLSLFGFGIVKKSRPAVFLGSLRIATGITKWCPVMALMGKLKEKECCSVEEEISEMEESLQES